MACFVDCVSRPITAWLSSANGYSLVARAYLVSQSPMKRLIILHYTLSYRMKIRE